jgi:phage baseplate assembly protein W
MAIITKQDLAGFPVYKGFSTFQRLGPPFTLTNIDLVKQDLLNTFHTPKGSRVMLPEFGSLIQQYIFDPFDDFTEQAIIEDAKNVIESDPRVSLQNISVTEFQYGLRIEMILLFVPSNVVDSLYVSYIREDETQ